MHYISVIAYILVSCYLSPLSFCVSMEMKINHLCQLDGKNESKVLFIEWNVIPKIQSGRTAAQLRPVLKPLRQPAFLVNRGIGYKYILLHLKVQSKTEGWKVLWSLVNPHPIYMEFF